MWKTIATLGIALGEDLANKDKRQSAESALEMALDTAKNLAPAGTVFARACDAALKVLHEGEALAGDVSTGGSTPAPEDVLK